MAYQRSREWEFGEGFALMGTVSVFQIPSSPRKFNSSLWGPFLFHRLQSELEGNEMKTAEIGLSLYQPIRETCFSGYVEVLEADRLVVGIEVVEAFEGGATLEIALLSDSDDCMVSPTELYRTAPLSKNDLVQGETFGFVIAGLEERYFCVRYIVSGGAFEKGELSTRVSADEAPWFVSSTELHEVSGAL